MSISRLALLPLCLSFVAAPAGAQEKVKLAVIPTQFDKSAEGLVPDLFDDYLLTAVQNTIDAEVIGQEDISALIGFEAQKDLVDCSDTSCIADIGGALGVDKIVVVKIARLGSDWVATAKIINIRETRVESRVNEIIGGNVKDLLRSTPALVAKLFGAATPSPSAAPEPSPEPTSTPSPGGTTSTAPSPTSEPSVKRDPNAGSGNRWAGGLMMVLGGLTSVIGQIVLTYSYADAAISGIDRAVPAYAAGTVVFLGGGIVEGIGTKIWANGTAQKMMGDPSASGAAGAYWLGWASGILGWVCGAGGFWLMEDEEDMAIVGGLLAMSSWGFSITSHLVFFIGGFGGSSVKTSGLSLPEPTVRYARTADGGVAPTYGFSMSF